MSSDHDIALTKNPIKDEVDSIDGKMTLTSINENRRLLIGRLKKEVDVDKSTATSESSGTPSKSKRKRKRCAFCVRKKDRKSQITCCSCSKPVCCEHSFVVCQDCI